MNSSDKSGAAKRGGKMSKKNAATPCPCGLLVDLTDTSEGMCPKELTNVAEYDDTFGLYLEAPKPPVTLSSQPLIPPPSSSSIATIPEGATAVLASPLVLFGTSTTTSANSTFSPFGLGLSMKNKKTSLCRIKSEKSARAVDPFSPIFTETRAKDPFSPFPSTPERKSFSDGDCGACSGGANLSDSDSLLDLNNLSGFSVSDSDGQIEQLISQLKVQESHVVEHKGEVRSSTPVTTPPTKEELERKYLTHHGEEEAAASGGGAANAVETQRTLADKRRRESVNSKLQKLSLLISNPSPVPSPPTPNSQRNYVPTPITTPSRNSQSFQPSTPKSTVSTMTSPLKQSAYTVADSTRPRIPESPVSSCNRYFAAPPALVMPTSIKRLDEDGEDNTLNNVKRLSFGSTTSESSTSPTKSVRKEFRPKPTAAVRGAPQQRLTQPLKAKPVPGFEPEPHPPSSPKNAESTSRGNASPITPRKFIPPVAHSSPLVKRSAHLSSSYQLGTTTPTKKNYTAVRSSGYGQQSMNTSLNTSSSGFKIPESPRRAANVLNRSLSIPSSPKTTSATSVPSGRQIMGIKGQIPNSYPAIRKSIQLNSELEGLEKSSDVVTNMKTIPVPTTTGLRCPSVRKENRPKILTSSLPRPGFMCGKK